MKQLIDSSELDFKIVQTIELNLKLININTIKEIESRTLVYELDEPLGPRSKYGLLGIKFVPKDIDKLIVRIRINDMGPIIHRTLLDTTRLGIHSEYSETIIQTLLSKAKDWYLGPGILTFHRGAWGEIYSSNQVFKELTTALLQDL